MNAPGIADGLKSPYYETREAAKRDRLENEKARLRAFAADVAGDPGNDDLWRELCRARATLRALARCAR